MARVIEPQGQKLHTNIAVVRLTRAKKKFEIACYPNKVQEWRTGVETDIDEVLQSERVFVNVSQGEFAKESDLVAGFGHSNQPKVCLEMLKLGEIQVSELERGKASEKLFHEISAIVVEKCVDANTNRALTVSLVEKAMKQAQVAITPNHSAKQQALRIIPELTAKYPIARAKMMIRATLPAAFIESTSAELGRMIAIMMNEIPRASDGDPYVAIGQIEPAKYREIDDLLRGKGTMEVLNPRVVYAG